MTSLFILLQYLLPQHWLSRLAGVLANSQRLRRPLIRWFIRRYQVDLSEAAIQDYRDFPHFNAFFTRALAPGARPLADQPNAVLCPADGVLSELGRIHDGQLLQAKGRYYSLAELLAVTEEPAAHARQGVEATNPYYADTTTASNSAASQQHTDHNTASTISPRHHGADTTIQQPTEVGQRDHANPERQHCADPSANRNNAASLHHASVAAYQNGSFATIYLAPKDYHRVHLPVASQLVRTRYIPGRLFSVNQATAARVPRLFARNERLVCEFATSYGPMALVMVGAMIVAGIETVWGGRATPGKLQVVDHTHRATPIEFLPGAELGRFLLGSTVIVLFPAGRVTLNSELQAGSTVRMGQLLGRGTIQPEESQP